MVPQHLRQLNPQLRQVLAPLPSALKLQGVGYGGDCRLEEVATRYASRGADDGVAEGEVVGVFFGEGLEDGSCYGGFSGCFGPVEDEVLA